MPGLDTNVLVGWLVQDDLEQMPRIQKLFESAKISQVRLFIPCTVALELEWVLRSRYGFNKADVLLAFTALLETRELDFQLEAALEIGLHLYRNGVADFGECLHSGLCSAEGRAPLLTFDQKASRLAGVELIAE